MRRRERLRTPLTLGGYQAFVAPQRPNQLYFVPHADPVSGLPPIPFLICQAEETIALPGAPFYYACRDQLTACEVVEMLVGGPDPVEHLAALLIARGLDRVVFDHLPSRLAER